MELLTDERLVGFMEQRILRTAQEFGIDPQSFPPATRSRTRSSMAFSARRSPFSTGFKRCSLPILRSGGPQERARRSSHPRRGCRRESWNRPMQGAAEHPPVLYCKRDPGRRSM